jgi:hypothetical protein
LSSHILQSQHILLKTVELFVSSLQRIVKLLLTHWCIFCRTQLPGTELVRAANATAAGRLHRCMSLYGTRAATKALLFGVATGVLMSLAPQWPTNAS